MILYESSDLQNVTIKHSKNGDAQFASFLLVFDLSEHGIVQYLCDLARALFMPTQSTGIPRKSAHYSLTFNC